MSQRERQHSAQHQRTAMAGELDHVLGGKAMRRTHIYSQRLVQRRARLGDHAAEAHAKRAPGAAPRRHEQALQDRQRVLAAYAHDADAALARGRGDRRDSVIVEHRRHYNTAKHG